MHNARRFSKLILMVCFCATAIAASAQMRGSQNASQDDICANVQESPDSSIAACTKLIEQAASNERQSAVYNNRGVAYAAKGNADQAAGDYTKAIELDRANGAAYANRGDLYFRKGELDRAIADFDRTIALPPGPGLERAYMGRTLALLRKKDSQGALKSADAMVRQEPNSPVAVETRAYVLRAMGRRKEAIAEYRKALKIAPDIPQLRQEIETALRGLGATP